MRSRIIIVEVGIAVALATVLSLIPVFKMPTGGMITAGSLVPVFYIAIRHGARAGFITGALAGCAQLLMDAWLIHPVQVVLDYPLAWGLLGLAGLVAGRQSSVPMMVLGIAVGGLLRDIAHTISCMVWFSQYCPPGTNLLGFCVSYQLFYMVPETLIAIILVPLVIRRLARRPITG